jgi:hypothetical protein
MVEESVPTFATLCKHQDPANLSADQDYIKQYEEIVQLYAGFASKEVGKDMKTPISWPVAIRFRTAGLQALKCVASSESLGSETGRQLGVIIPAVLMNIYSESGVYLKRLEGRELEKEEQDKEQAKEQATRRRQSVSTVRTAEDDGGDPIAASGTTEDADKLAEEEVGVVALQALRNIFLGANPGQLRLATSAILKFIAGHVNPQQKVQGSQDENWATTLMAMICGWAPVQVRYAILVSAMETLIRSPIVEENLEQQLVLANVINYLLSSTINFIGLSVMDVLVGLISHTLLLLQLGGSGSVIKPHHQQRTSTMSEDNPVDPHTSGNMDGLVNEVVKEPSHYRIQLLDTVQSCMASLATHVYYTDQISDMVTAILTRLKPPTLSGISSAAEAIEDPVGAVNAVANSASLQEKTPHISDFFSFETARLTALEAVKNIIKTANTRRPDGSSASVSRGSVGVSAWEGTQWLLRDPSGKVRKAYVDALTTWLNMEKNKDDLMLVEDYRTKEKENDKGGLARRATSNASHREKSPKRGKNTFLSLLHLAVYENALKYPESESDYLLLHLLLTTLVDKLGINAVRSGLPMIWRLQEDIAAVEDPASKVRIGSLVHGYLWAISMALDFETSSVGRALHAEISRRNSKGLWVQNIRIPPMPLDRIQTPHPDNFQLPKNVVESEALNPFDNREAFVERIAEGYSSSLYSPPNSPPSSPSRSLSLPFITPQTLKPVPQLSPKIKEDLLADWTRDVCIAENTKDSSAASITASRTATSNYQKNNYLGVNIPNGTLDSPLPSPKRAHSRSRPPSTAYGLVGRVNSPHRNRSPSGTPGSTSSRSAVRVDELKRVLSGAAPRTSYSIRPATRQADSDHDHDSSGSDSLVSIHSLSDASFITADLASGLPTQPGSHNPEAPATPAITPRSRGQASQRPASSSSGASSPQSLPSNANYAHTSAFDAHDVPPVPPIPASLRDKSASPTHSPNLGQQSPNINSHHRSPSGNLQDRPKTAPGGNGSIAARKSRSMKRGSQGARSVHERSGSRASSGNVDGASVHGNGNGTARGQGGKKVRKPDFSNFLDSIDAGDADEDVEVDLKGVGKAPY